MNMLNAKSFPSFRQWLGGAFLGLAALALVGCGKNATKSEDATVRFLNLAPESGSLSVLLNTDSSNWQTGVAYQASTDFKSIPSGSQRVRVSNAGGTIIDSTIGFAGQRKQMLIVYGGQSSVGASVLQNDIPTSTSGNAKLRVVSYAVGISAFDVYMTLPTEDYRTVEPKLRNVTGGLYEVPVGTYTVRLTSTGTKDLLFEMAAKNFEDRKYYNLGLYNQGSGALPNGFWVVQDDDTAPQLLTNTVSRVRGINSQAGNATVNVRVGAALAFTNIPFGGISSYTRIAAGDGTVSFTETTAGSTLSSFTGAFAGGRDYSIFLAPGLAGGPVTAFRVLDTTFPPSSGKARVRLVNASSAADLSLALSFTPTTSTVATRAASGYIEVTAGAGTPVTITQGATGTPVLSLTGTDLTAGLTYTFVVSGVPGALGLTVRQDN
jgi:hypothetical protein